MRLPTRSLCAAYCKSRLKRVRRRHDPVCFIHEFVPWKYIVSLIVSNELAVYACCEVGVTHSRKETIMLYWALVFLVVAIVAAIFGFGGVAIAAAGIAKILFFVFLVFFVITLITHLSRRGSAGV